MIDVKHAIKIACEFVAEVYPDGLLKNPTLEEVERSENGEFWCITLSFSKELGQLSEALGETRQPQYKVLTIHSDTGEVNSMKIRQPV